MKNILILLLGLSECTIKGVIDQEAIKVTTVKCKTALNSISVEIEAKGIVIPSHLENLKIILFTADRAEDIYKENRRVYQLTDLKMQSKLIVSSIPKSVLKDGTSYKWFFEKNGRTSRYNVKWTYKDGALVFDYFFSEAQKKVEYLMYIGIYALVVIGMLLFKHYKEVLVVGYIKRVRELEEAIREEAENRGRHEQ